MGQNLFVWRNKPLVGFCYRHELKKASHITKLPKGKHSVKGEKLFTFPFHSSGSRDSFSYQMASSWDIWSNVHMCYFFFLGLGRTAPDPNATVTLDGVQVPLGNGVNTNIDDTSLLYNEYPLNKPIYSVFLYNNFNKWKSGFLQIIRFVSHLPALLPLSPLFCLSALTSPPPGISCMTWRR